MTFDPTGKENCLMTDSSVIYRYLHGGNGKVTLVNPNTLKAHSYKFLKPTNEKEFPEDTIFVYVLHEGHKMYLGMLSGSDLRRTSKSSFSEDTEAMRGARYIVKMANRQDVVNANMMHLYHAGTCCCCGRQLESPKALAQGIGKKCLQVYNIKMMKVPWDGN